MTKTEVYINKIIDETGLTKVEIQSLVDEKHEELKGLISDEGALFIISKELGIDIKEKQKLATLYIVDLQKDMKNINVVGRIKRIREPHMFSRKDGTTGQVQNFTIQDKTKSIRCVIWDKHVEGVMDNEAFVENTLVQIINGYIKWSDYNNEYEFHVARWGKLVFNPEVENLDEYPEIEVIGDDW